MGEPALRALLLLGGGYLAASVNFAVVFARVGLIPDPRQAHSGNPGVSNVYRIAGPAWAAVVLLLDVGRAAALALAALWWLPEGWAPVGGVGLIAGNRWPACHGFRGGKGVANLLGFVAVLAPVAAAASALLWVGVYGAVRQVFVASFAMVLGLAVGVTIRLGASVPGTAGTLIMVILILEAHRPNIARWRAGRRRPPEAPG